MYPEEVFPTVDVMAWFATWKRVGKDPEAPVPMFEAFALKVTDVPAVAAGTEVAPAVRSAKVGAALTVRLFAHARVTVCAPEVMVTLAVLVPAVAYDFGTDAPEPVRLSVPLQEYVYVPVPPEAVALQVAEPPAVIDVGETVQEPLRAGTVTATDAFALALPFVPVQVTE